MSPNELLNIALLALQNNNMVTALQYMQQVVEVAPEIPLHRRNLGELLRRLGQFEAAIRSHQMAIQLEPYSAENHFLIGLTYNDCSQIELAIKHYHLALSYNPNYGLAWNNLGASLERLGDKQQAKIAYTTAIALNAQHAEAQNNLGAIYSEDGRLEEARHHFTAAISANPDFVDAHYNLSSIKTYQTDDPHLAFLESIMPKIKNYPVRSQIKYQFSLGKALDDTMQYASAFKAYATGNQLQNQLTPWDKTNLENIVKRLPNVFNKEFFKDSANAPDPRCPIFIVGMPRAGTTLIEQILSTHQSIYGAGELSTLDDVICAAYLPTGLSFCDWAMQITDQECINLGKKYLDSVWKLAPDKPFIIDKMPGNSFYVGMIQRMLPQAKIIHAIRDPMDSCFSCYTHLFKDTMYFAYDLNTLGHYYILYAKAMQHWQTVLPPDRIFNLSYEDMVANHEILSKQLLDYIGLPWDPNCLNFYKNNRSVKTASLTQVRQPIYKTSVQRWRHFEKELQPLMSIVAPYRNIKGISA